MSTLEILVAGLFLAAVVTVTCAIWGRGDQS